MDYHKNKYLKYKEKYMQLKQFKNNNDFEGGWGWDTLKPKLPGIPGKHYLRIIEDSMNLYNVPIDERTESLCLTAVKRMARSLMHVPDNIKTYDMCLIAVQSEGFMLSDVPKQFRDFFMCYTAIALAKTTSNTTIKYVIKEILSINEYNLLIEIADKKQERKEGIYNSTNI